MPRKSPTRTRAAPIAVEMITPETLALWRELRAMTARERNGRRYREYLDGTNKLATALGLWWGDAGQPLTVDGPDPPDYMRFNPYQAERWRIAWQWRCALIEAEGES